MDAHEERLIGAIESSPPQGGGGGGGGTPIYAALDGAPILLGCETVCGGLDVDCGEPPLGLPPNMVQ